MRLDPLLLISMLVCPDDELAALSWCKFMEYLDKKKYPELSTYLKERRPNANEPVQYEEFNSKEAVEPDTIAERKKTVFDLNSNIERINRPVGSGGLN